MRYENEENNKISKLDVAYEEDAWYVYEYFPDEYDSSDDNIKRKHRQGHIECSCNMDNFDMYDFLIDIGVKGEDIKGGNH